jgi:hypothetical protein
MRILLGPDLAPAILDAGYNFDFIDSAAIDRAGIHYPVLVLPSVDRLPLATYRKIEEYAHNGGMVIAVKSLPSRAPGMTEEPRDSAAVAQISHDLFVPDAKNAKLVAGPADVGAAIGAVLQPDVAIAPATPTVGFIHRKLADADVYFVANTDNQPHTFSATFRTTRPGAEWWNPFDGNVTGVGPFHPLMMHLAPYESRVVVFTDNAVPAPMMPATRQFAPIDLAHDWKVTFDKTSKTETMQTLHSWADEDAAKYYSGAATYERMVDIPDTVAHSGRVVLDFGQGTPVAREQLHQAGTRTWLDPPLREAAVVYVNGKRAGSVWRAPFNLDVTAFLHAGSNEFKIVVGNTDINELAGRAGPDYRLLNLRYGEKFTPQDMDHLAPLPSGILGPLRLISGQDAEK